MKKVLILGVDGMDPMLSKKFMDQGKMPALKKFVERGACREDLVLLGAVPTVTPPMWTTLATGAYPNTHGITAFFNQHPQKLETAIYSLDSRLCKAEPLWNVTAEDGLRTLVWHWPGSSWPPTSDSENLHVVDGTQPTSVNMGTALLDWEKIELASFDIDEVKYHSHEVPVENVNGCVITGLQDTVADESGKNGRSTFFKSLREGAKASDNMTKEELEAALTAKQFTTLVMSEDENEIANLGNAKVDVGNSPIKEASGWNNAPENAKEFTLITSNGFVRRSGLILQNEDGIYDRIAIYKNKKAEEPIATVGVGEAIPYYVDEVIDGEEIKQSCRRLALVELKEDGSYLKIWMSHALDVEGDFVWHPKSLYKDIVNNVGYVPCLSTMPGKDPDNLEQINIPTMDFYCDWQARCLKYLIDDDRYDVIFSHLHNVDNAGHLFWHYAKHFDDWNNDAQRYQRFMERIYIQTDNYLKEFLPYLEQGWSIFIVSDHGLISEENHVPVLTEGCVSIPVMKELGYTVLKKDENGNDLREIDWSQTKAIAVRGGNIYINIIGRTDHGIVTPEEQYELETQIITDLYDYRDHRTGKRVISLALRNKDALILGLGGSKDFGDVIFFMDEGFNLIHMDSLPTYSGYFETSVSPIFVAAGEGIKAGYIDRHIRQADVAPTIAALLNVRAPKQNEGSIIHQILQ